MSTPSSQVIFHIQIIILKCVIFQQQQQKTGTSILYRYKCVVETYSIAYADTYLKIDRRLSYFHVLYVYLSLSN